MKYPVGGPREPVYSLMRSLGFTMSNWSDKEWTRDNITVQIYGAGSMARVYKGETMLECELDRLKSTL